MEEFVEFHCPQCAGTVQVSQIQGDRCPGCSFEFKWFGPGEARSARDYYEVLTRQKHFLELEMCRGYIVAHE